jgi:hypothetical protein
MRLVLTKSSPARNGGPSQLVVRREPSQAAFILNRELNVRSSAHESEEKDWACERIECLLALRY